MAVGFSNTNKPINPRGLDASPKGYNRAALYSGKALDFDGVNDSISVSYSNTLGGVWTWVSIIEPDALSGYQELFGGMYSVSNATIYLKEDQLTIYTNQDNFNTAFNFETGKKYHVACSQSGDTISVYVNGQAAGSVSLTIPLNSTSGTYIIGKRPNQANEYFNGKMSGVKLFNTALTAAQVADLYNNPEKIVPTGVEDTALKLWLPMMEGAGTTAYDGSGNGNHGTISGATWTHGIGSPVAQTAVIDWNKQSYFAGNGGDDAYFTSSFADFNGQTAVTMYAEFVWQGITGNQNIIDWGGNLGLRIRIEGSNDYFQVLQKGGSNLMTSTTAATENAFARIAARSDSNGLKLFLNGSEIASNSTALDSTASSTDFLIGRYAASTAEFFNGIIPEAKVWTTALTDAQLESLTAGTTSPEDYTSGAVAHWTGASEYEDQVGSYDLTAIGSPVRFLAPQGLTGGRDIFNALFENVRKQGALNLDGNSWAEVHDNASLDISDAITLEAWVKPSDTGANKMIISKWSPFANGQRSYLFYQSLSETLYFSISTDGVGSNTIVSPSAHKDDWFHFVGTYDGATQKLYVNGSQVASQAQTGSIFNGTFQLEIGRHHGDNSAINPSPIAQPRIYNRALTASEVLRNYNSGKSTYQ